MIEKLLQKQYELLDMYEDAQTDDERESIAEKIRALENMIQTELF